jgi:predicted Zn-dependent protease
MDNAHSKLKGLLWIGGTVAIVFIFVRGLPIIAKNIPWSVEKKMGRYLQNIPNLRACYTTQGAADFQKIIDRLYPKMPGDSEFPLQVQVIAGKTVNAFASLGGQIYVYDGLIQKAESAEELAGVLAHEIEHVRHCHIMQGMFVRFLSYGILSMVFDPGSAVDPRLLHALMNLRFSREQEAEADYDGIQRLNAAKIDVTGFEHFFEREENQSKIPSLLSDHPTSENRSQLIKKFYQKDTIPVLNNEEWAAVKKMCASLAP